MIKRNVFPLDLNVFFNQSGLIYVANNKYLVCYKKKCSVLSISFSFPYCSKSKCALFPDIYHILSLVLRFTFLNTRFWGKALKKSRKRNYLWFSWSSVFYIVGVWRRKLEEMKLDCLQMLPLHCGRQMIDTGAILLPLALLPLCER